MGVEVEVGQTAFLTSKLNRGEWSPACLGCLTPEIRTHGTNSTKVGQLKDSAEE